MVGQLNRGQNGFDRSRIGQEITAFLTRFDPSLSQFKNRIRNRAVRTCQNTDRSVGAFLMILGDLQHHLV